MIRYQTDRYQELVSAMTRRHVSPVWLTLVEHVGHENARRRPDFVKDVNRRSHDGELHERTVREVLGAFRDAGIPALGDRDGYWLGTPAETLEWSRSYRRHGITCLRRAYRMVKAAEQILDPGKTKEEARALEAQLSLDLGQNYEEDIG